MDLALPPDLPDPPGGVIVKEAPVESSVGEMVRRDSDRIEERKKEESWVRVAQEKKSLKKHKVEVLKKDGIHTGEIPDEIIENSTPLWRDFLVGSFWILRIILQRSIRFLTRYGGMGMKLLRWMSMM